jgi:hypothetical protein
MSRNMKVLVSLATLIHLAFGLGACGSEERQELAVTVVPDQAAQSVSLGKASHLVVSSTLTGGMVDLVIDCHPDENVDQVGLRLAVTIGGQPVAGELEHAGYVRVRGMRSAGPLTIDVVADDGPAQCSVRLGSAPGTCPLSVFRSVNVDHQHVDPTKTPSSWESFPVSGDHYPVWAAWNMSWPLAIRTGYLLHDLEHGGIVLSYACVNELQSAECTKAKADLLAARTAFGQVRTSDTPDPQQPSLYAARAWRWGLLADCYDATELSTFMTSRFRHGREDVDSDTAPFDATQ